MDLLSVLGGWLFLLIGIAVSIGLHELGHLLPAKKFGVKVTKYMIGFGPTLFSRRRGETEYGVKLIPLGGYIQMVGMLPPADATKKLNPWSRLTEKLRQGEPESAEDDARSFYRLKPWQKLIVMFGGPFANLLIAVVLALTLFSGFGVYERTNQVQSVVSCIPTDSNLDCKLEGDPSPASVAGLKSGDKIVEVNGKAITRWSEVDALISSKINQKVSLLVDRAGSKINLIIFPAQITLQGKSRAYLGLYLESGKFQQTPVEALSNLGVMLSGTADMIVQLPLQAVNAVSEIIPGSARNPEGAISIVGLGQYSGELAANTQLSLQDKLLSQFSLLMSLNVALFVFNMVPLVPLDGGHIAGALYEAVKRGIWRLRGKKLETPVDTAQMMPIAFFVASCLIVLSAILILRDILNPLHL